MCGAVTLKSLSYGLEVLIDSMAIAKVNEIVATSVLTWWEAVVRCQIRHPESRGQTTSRLDPTNSNMH